MKGIITDDGTIITCQSRGEGPPLLIIHGTSSDHQYWQFAAHRLSEHFNVFIMDRRGRGESGDHPEYTIEKEFADVAALLNSFDHTVYVLGHSFGGLCALEASLLSLNVRELILYEPVIAFDQKKLVLCDQLESLLESNRPEAALVFFMGKIVGISDQEIAVAKMQPDWKGRISAAPTIPREIKALARYQYLAESFRNIGVPTTLFTGGESPPIFKTMVSAVQAAVPNAKVIELPGQGHIAMRTAPDLFVEQVIKAVSHDE